jgi:hypothetical protein
MKQTMRIEFNRMRLLAAACGMITILALAPLSAAQQAAPAATKTVASSTAKTALAAQPAAKPVAEEESAAPNSANQQGIKVHGHWVLQVKNADGTLGERREFDNSLVGFGTNTSGDQVLAAMLSGTATVVDLAIAFISGNTAGVDPSTLCQGNRSVATNCFMLVVNSGTLSVGLYSDIQAGLQEAVYFSPTVKIVLSGNYIVPSGLGTAGSIAMVQTYAGLCGVPGTNGFMKSISGQVNTFQMSTVAPASCNYTAVTPGGTIPDVPIAMGALTSTAVSPAPLAVTSGQIVQVTVTISFS